jgi:chromosome segregation ATPase
MTGPRRTKSTQRPAVREDVFLPTSGPGVPQRSVGVAELVRRLGEAESKLQAVEKDRAADAELIGNLLGELADRDRRIKALDQRALDDEAKLVDLETQLAMVESRTSAVDDRTQELESALRRTDSMFAELLRRLNAAHGGDTDLSQLHDLLAVTLGTLDITRAITSETARKLDETKSAMGNIGAREAERGLAQTLQRAEAAVALTMPVDRAIARMVDRLRDVERRERELGDLRGGLLEDASMLIAEVQQLRDGMGNLSRRPGGSIPRMRKAPPSKLPTRKR